jgi:hypothetical protein
MNERLKELLAQAWKETTLAPENCYFSDDYEVPKEFVRFADLVRQDEQNACATECLVQMSLIPAQAWTVNPYTQCAVAIRARGNPDPAFKNYLDDKWSGIV